VKKILNNRISYRKGRMRGFKGAYLLDLVPLHTTKRKIVSE